MIIKIHNEQDFVIGLASFRQVGRSGYECPNGEFVYVEDLWVHPEHRGRGILQEIISIILMKTPDAKWGYFQRDKFNNRMSKAYPRASVERVAQIRN